VPFVRYTRDRRGYETTYLMHGYRAAQGPGQTRVLYFFRSPAHVKVGRRAFDDEAREALEHTHPDLNFDWTALGREPSPYHFEDREQRGGANGRRGVGRPQPASPAAPADDTVLGRTLGTAEAARLRTRYGELVQRINRRAPTPEDRIRLIDRVERLNPDEWAEEASVRTGVQTVEAAWDEIRRELPSRRRGGRRRDEHRRPAERERPADRSGPADAGETVEGPSAIIEPRGDEADAHADDREEAGADHRAAAPRDGDAVGGSAADDAAGNRFPGGE
jgi:hypothetical protein